MKNVICTKCGASLQIPEELTEYSCVYCGERMTETPPVGADFEAVLPQLAGCVTNFRGYQSRITADAYVGAFEEYEAGCADVIRALSGAVTAAASKTPLLEAACERFLDDLKASQESLPEWKSRRNRIKIFGDDKLVTAVFFVPMVRKLKLPVSEEFCEILQKKWVQRYPKSPFYLGDYETIVEGFQRKLLGLCFITTAVCRASGLPDDCAELTVFRAFRDGYLRTCPDGKALIDEYYNVAPGIVTAIDLCGDGARKYEKIRKSYLKPCYEDLQSGRNEACKNRYVRMVTALKKEYLS